MTRNFATLRPEDWNALRRLRDGFLNETQNGDYWQTECLLEIYDQFFARRIAWKWQFVMSDLKRRNWRLPLGAALDWGCGTGAASQTLLENFGAQALSTVHLYDRSALSMSFAAKKLKQIFPELHLEQGKPNPCETILLSHVLNELSDTQLGDLLKMLESVTAIIWVESGAKRNSRRFISVRESLRKTFNLVAPCTHNEICGLLKKENDAHWCHQFAEPPSEAFTSEKWSTFAKEMQIDLRDLPLSYLVLDKRNPPSLPESATRIIGKPRVYKGFAKLLGCDKNGVGEKELSKRKFPEAFKQIKKGDAPTIQLWLCETDEIIDIQFETERA